MNDFLDNLIGAVIGGVIFIILLLLGKRFNFFKKYLDRITIALVILLFVLWVIYKMNVSL